MSDAAGLPDELRFLPERVARHQFASAFRGYDAEEVRAYLGDLARELRQLREREDRLRNQLEDVKALSPKEDTFDEARVTEILGEETAKVLAAAREAATQIKAKAEENVARMVREAQDDLAHRRAESELELARRREEIEEEGERIKAEAVVIRREGEHAAAAEIEAARQRGREMVAEAQLVRERVLKDLARRRRVARQQIEQLRAGRERLLEAYQVVRQTLDHATDELMVALPEAKIAAEQAARRAADEDEPSIDDLEAEVAAARAAALPLVDPGGGAEPEAPADFERAGVDVSPTPPAAAVPEPPPPARADEPVTVDPPIFPPVAPPSAASIVFAPEPAPADEPLPEGTAVEAEPELPEEQVDDAAPEDAVVEERRSSSLRLFRRRSTPSRHAAEPAEDVEPAETPTEVQVFAEQAGAVSEPEPEPVAEEPATAGAPEAEAPDAAVDPEPQPESEPVADAEPEPQPEPVAEEVVEAEPPVAAPSPSQVDELFARMKAEREEAVTRAREVLAEPAADVEPEQPDPAETIAAAEQEPEQSSPVAADALAVRDERLRPLEQAVTRRLKRVLADEQNEVLDGLRRRRAGVPALDALPGRAAHAERYGSAAAAGLEEAWHVGLEQGGRPAPWPPAPAELVSDIEQDVVAPLRERLERVLGQADVDDEEQGERVRATYREWRTERAESAARQLVVAAFSAGMYEAAPEGTRLCWLVDNGGVPCPDAEDNALAGPVTKGQPFPTGHLRPPAHPGCRCVAVPEPQ